MQKIKSWLKEHGAFLAWMFGGPIYTEFTLAIYILMLCLVITTLIQGAFFRGFFAIQGLVMCYLVASRGKMWAEMDSVIRDQQRMLRDCIENMETGAKIIAIKDEVIKDLKAKLYGSN